MDKILFTFYFFLVIKSTVAQKLDVIHFLNLTQTSIHENVSLKQIDSINTTIQQQLEASGHFLYKLDSLHKSDSIQTYYISKGKKLGYIRIKNIPQELQNQLFIKTDSITLATDKSEAFLQKINAYYESIGQSFTKTKLTNIHPINDTLFCELNIKNSQQRYINKIVVKNYTQFSKGHRKYFLKDRKPFSNQTLIRAENKLKQLDFVESIQKPAVLFTKDSTQLYIYLKKKNANSIDALLGFTNDEQNDKLQFNGHVDLVLKNTLHKGETLAFKWISTTNEQQEIDLYLKRPYIFNSPFSPEYNLNIYRQDSSFVNTKSNINLQVQIFNQHNIGGFYQTETSSITSQLSSLKSFDKYFLGLNYEFISNKTNYNTPLFSLKLKVGTGSKNQESNTIQQQLFESKINYNQPLNQRSLLHLANENGYLRSDDITTNELFRLGGAQSMRGFLEQSIFSHLYNYSTVEYRYFTQPESYIYGFSDFGEFRTPSEKNRLISFGLGYTLKVKSSLLKISYALGKNQDTDFNPSEGLFHINVVTLF